MTMKLPDDMAKHLGLIKGSKELKQFEADIEKQIAEKVAADKQEAAAIKERNGKCPEHGTQQIEMGFGLAGGGYGAYNYCGLCGVIVDKFPELED